MVHGSIKAGHEKHRCKWAGTDPVYVEYHDNEWGVPLHNDCKLFELFILEGMQAGLSWITILKKRQNFRQAFGDFDAKKLQNIIMIKSFNCFQIKTLFVTG